MAQFSFLVILGFLSIFFELIHGQINNYTCVSFSPNSCVLENLALTTFQKNFQLIPNQPVNEIKNFRFSGSTVKVLTSDVCDALPFITHFSAGESSVTVVDENAFKNCTKLIQLSLESNSLTSLPSRLFEANRELQEVALGENKLTRLDENMFKNNNNLLVVHLYRNALRSLPPKLFENNQNLRFFGLQDNQFRELLFLDEMPVLVNVVQISLYNNKLIDLDADKLLEKFPNLRTIGLYGNEFWCKRQEVIKNFLEEKGVTEVSIGSCIRDSEEIQKVVDAVQISQENAREQTLKNVREVDTRLTSEVVSMKQGQQLNNLIFIVLGSILTILVIFQGYLVNKLRNKVDISEQLEPMPCNQNATQNYNDGAESYDNCSEVPMPRPLNEPEHVYDHLQFK